MIQQLNIEFDDEFENPNILTPIRHNIRKQLEKFKYISYKKIDIKISMAVERNISIEWDDKKSATIACLADILPDIGDDNKDTQELYNVIFECLKKLWAKSKWDIDDLDNVFEEIKNDKFSVSIQSRTITSPDKKNKAGFRFEIFPNFSNYHLEFLSKKVKRSILFFKGHPEPSIFLGFFSNHYWRDNEHFIISDFNKEIFFVFNIHQDSFTLEYSPKYNSIEKCKDCVKALQFDTPQEDRLKLLGIPG
jgi:hypothetical protein